MSELADFKLLHKTQTGLASEFFVAAELIRRNFIVTLTLGNTKAVDLIVMNDEIPVLVQVKGIQRRESICWNISRDSVREDIFYVLVNIHADKLLEPEYFILSGKEMKATLKCTPSKRDYVDYSTLNKSLFKGAWNKLRVRKEK